MPYAKIKTATTAELVKIKGISEKDAIAICEYFSRLQKKGK
jgi:ERCC4-type nuclease